MSSSRWRVMACAIVIAASSVAGPDQPAVMVAKNAPVHARVVIAKLPTLMAPPIVRLAENPPAIAPPVVAATPNPPPPVAAVTAAQEPPATDSPSSVTAKPPAVTPAKNPPAVIGTPPIVAATTDAPPSVADPAPVIDAPPPAFDRRILAVHNRERQNLGLEPLNWNPGLAESARRWADHLAQTGRFEHAPENHSSPEGENLWAGTKGYYTPEAMVGAWIREKRFFRPGVFPDNSTTGRVEDIGHYTQVIWRATREVGCAEATSAAEDILVCRYAEAGNYRGEQPF
jgi:uncharacterized protein YkwD